MDIGVAISDGELAVPDDADDIDAERALAIRNGVEAMGMGSECLVGSFGFLVDILSGKMVV